LGQIFYSLKIAIVMTFLVTSQNLLKKIIPNGTFIFRCNQSDKVLTFGQNTGGTVDGFNGNDYVTDCIT